MESRAFHIMCAQMPISLLHIYGTDENNANTKNLTRIYDAAFGIYMLNNLLGNIPN